MSEEKKSNHENIPDWEPPPLDPANLSEEEKQEIYDFVRGRIYAKSVKGHFHTWRVIFVYFTQIIFFGLPWLEWNDRQAFLLDLGSRKFYIFGLVLWPQDIFYMALILIISAYGLFLFTALMGRLFCGYACPQTVYTEIFMWIERQIEGDRSARMRLDQSPWNFNKIFRKGLKHACYIIFALAAGFTLVGYFVPIRGLGHELLSGSFSPWEWFWFLFYAFMMWGHAGILREAVCKYMCPYARFQSVMVDSDTMVVTYDRPRGEPRGGRSRKVNPAEAGLGDCIDCKICVNVCPTGIDIRKGLQYMCIGCGACIDGCNEVMDKMGYKRGLIRYTSENAMIKGLSRKQAIKDLFKIRTCVYLALLLILVTGLIVSLATRSTLRLDVYKDRGVLGRLGPNETAENVYRIQIINMTEEPRTFTLSTQSDDVKDSTIQLSQKEGGRSVQVDSFGSVWVPVTVRAPLSDNKQGNHNIYIKAESDEAGKTPLSTEVETVFFVPDL
ncbi:cytochrome c oxidase accessory protein CcoG [Basilea psittacipulmonis]|uniref:Cytochrome C oxidase n=1 Tax=Basilea psittacipulmonis DSM 24701 TaxID=1072685 RepID=A0A077DGQ0_9BURK|nr:cytochrome c oxidase accessory protein CcoG [Basilea psittacipulmonis]AIL32343.1 cytochrome C oxidase [Basilea psittacipulmonis DSM 24701]